MVAATALLFLGLILSGCEPSPIRYELTAYFNDNGRHFEKSVVQDVGWHGESMSIDNNPKGADFPVDAQALPILIRERFLVISDAGWYWRPNTITHACTGPYSVELPSANCEMQEEWSAYRALSRHANLSRYNRPSDYATFASVGYAFTGEVELKPEEVPVFFTFVGKPSLGTIKIIDSQNLEAEFGPGLQLERVVVRPTTKPISGGIVKLFPFIRLNANEQPPTTQSVQELSISPARLFYSYQRADHEDR